MGALLGQPVNDSDLGIAPISSLRRIGDDSARNRNQPDGTAVLRGHLDPSSLLTGSGDEEPSPASETGPVVNTGYNGSGASSSGGTSQGGKIISNLPPPPADEGPPPSLGKDLKVTADSGSKTGTSSDPSQGAQSGPSLAKQLKQVDPKIWYGLGGGLALLMVISIINR